MWFDHTRQPGDHRWVESFIEARRAEEVPRVNHKVDEPEAQERFGRDVAPRAWNWLFRWCGGEGLGLVSPRFGHRGDRVVSELVVCEHVPGLFTTDAGKQERSEAVSHHDVLDQVTHRHL